MPNTNKNNNQWKLSMTEWRGYVIRALEDIAGDVRRNALLTKETEGRIINILNECKEAINDNSTSIGSNSKSIAKIQGKVAGIGGLVSFVVTVLCILISKAIGLV